MSHTVGLQQMPQLHNAKMDISEANTSQESPSQSPDDDEEHQQSPTYVDRPESVESNWNNVTNNGKFTQSDGIRPDTGTHRGSDSLDNRKPTGLYLDVTNNSNNAVPLSSSPRSALTLANSHPLMFLESSSIEHDSDSEREKKPLNEAPKGVQPLRLGQPKVTEAKSTIASFSTRHTLTTLETNQLLNLAPNKQEPRTADTIEFGSSDDELDVVSEPDISQYQANVNPHYQSVVLVSRPDHQPTTNVQRKIPVSADLLSDSLSSLDSMSQHSFDEDLENNLVSVSISSSVLDDTGFNADDGAIGGPVAVDDMIGSPVSLPTDRMTPIPQYTATEEARDTRSWQKITLPDGRTREIDMKVIEPYKRVLSHGGYLNSGGHNAIVVFSACHLPDRSRKDYHYVMDNLFLYVVKTLDQLITDDYVLVYLHGGASRSNAPQFPWLKRCYQLLDRRLRKSLKTLYMVHPTFWLKSVVWMARPFISSKFWRKLVYVRTLDEMFHQVPVERAAVPEKVRKYDLKHT